MNWVPTAQSRDRVVCPVWTINYLIFLKSWSWLECSETSNKSITYFGHFCEGGRVSFHWQHPMTNIAIPNWAVGTLVNGSSQISRTFQLMSSDHEILLSGIPYSIYQGYRDRSVSLTDRFDQSRTGTHRTNSYVGSEMMAMLLKLWIPGHLRNSFLYFGDFVGHRGYWGFCVGWEGW